MVSKVSQVVDAPFGSMAIMDSPAAACQPPRTPSRKPLTKWGEALLRQVGERMEHDPVGAVLAGAHMQRRLPANTRLHLPRSAEG